MDENPCTSAAIDTGFEERRHGKHILPSKKFPVARNTGKASVGITNKMQPCNGKGKVTPLQARLWPRRGVEV
jgi:hypothetical protein